MSRENPFLFFEPDPYLLNPFRIIGVELDASPESIQAKVRVRELRLERDKQPVPDMHLERGQPARAQQALMDPLLRLTFELMYLATIQADDERR